MVHKKKKTMSKNRKKTRSRKIIKKVQRGGAGASTQGNIIYSPFKDDLSEKVRYKDRPYSVYEIVGFEKSIRDIKSAEEEVARASTGVDTTDIDRRRKQGEQAYINKYYEQKYYEACAGSDELSYGYHCLKKDNADEADLLLHQYLKRTIDAYDTRAPIPLFNEYDECGQGLLDVVGEVVTSDGCAPNAAIGILFEELLDTLDTELGDSFEDFTIEAIYGFIVELDNSLPVGSAAATIPISFVATARRGLAGANVAVNDVPQIRAGSAGATVNVPAPAGTGTGEYFTGIAESAKTITLPAALVGQYYYLLPYFEKAEHDRCCNDNLQLHPSVGFKVDNGLKDILDAIYNGDAAAAKADSFNKLKDAGRAAATDDSNKRNDDMTNLKTQLNTLAARPDLSGQERKNKQQRLYKRGDRIAIKSNAVHELAAILASKPTLSALDQVDLGDIKHYLTEINEGYDLLCKGMDTIPEGIRSNNLYSKLVSPLKLYLYANLSEHHAVVPGSVPAEFKASQLYSFTSMDDDHLKRLVRFLARRNIFCDPFLQASIDTYGMHAGVYKSDTFGKSSVLLAYSPNLENEAGPCFKWRENILPISRCWANIDRKSVV